MKTTLRCLLLAGAAAACISVATSAQAVPAPPNPAQFSIIETPGDPGFYTVTNNSVDWYIYQFFITHDSSADGSQYSFFPTALDHWLADDCSAGCPGFKIGDQPTFDFSSIVGSNSDVAHMIGPGQQASEFFFQTSVAAGNAYRILLVDLNGNIAEVSNVPLPAALPLMGSILGGGWLLTRWRRRKRRTNEAEAPSPA